jgi:hypothetical protein
MPGAIAKLHGATLEQMRNYVSMALGISDKSYVLSFGRIANLWHGPRQLYLTIDLATDLLNIV